MSHSTLKPRGRPKSANSLTPAQKQAAYRQRCAARAIEIQADVDFKRRVECLLDDEIVKYTANANEAFYDEDKRVNLGSINALLALKIKLGFNGNVAKTHDKIYNQDEIF